MGRIEPFAFDILENAEGRYQERDDRDRPFPLENGPRIPEDVKFEICPSSSTLPVRRRDAGFLAGVGMVVPCSAPRRLVFPGSGGGAVVVEEKTLLFPPIAPGIGRGFGFFIRLLALIFLTISPKLNFFDFIRPGLSCHRGLPECHRLKSWRGHGRNRNAGQACRGG